ncbi:hypothetical protein LZ30DRAFT_470310 [Colletotrichum cereale]|nr:hypothetical protein LZ30DRAFT_470310 [Colletotrichum cereale]
MLPAAVPPCRPSSVKDGAACKMGGRFTKHACATEGSRVDYIPLAWSNGNWHKHGIFFFSFFHFISFSTGWESFICRLWPLFLPL